jgi:hypothetical protein
MREKILFFWSCCIPNTQKAKHTMMMLFVFFTYPRPTIESVGEAGCPKMEVVESEKFSRERKTNKSDDSSYTGVDPAQTQPV